MSVSGVSGDICAPSCSKGIFGKACPKDRPAGVSATPGCDLEDSSSGKQYCALECDGDDDCEQ